MEIIRKTSLLLASGMVLFSTIAPSFSAKVQADSVTSQISIRSSEATSDFSAEINKFNDYITKIGIQDIQALSLTQQDMIYNNYMKILSRERNPIVAVLGAIAAAVTIAQSLYAAGRYAAMQCVSHNWLSRSAYKTGNYFGMIVATFGLTVALGFDDYMYGRG
ncbi:MAG: hypothetical protein ACI31W_04910 [Lactococcus sp.]